MADYSTMDAALERIAPYGPDLANGFSSHAPMAVEALAALDRADAVMPWLDRYVPAMVPRPAPHERITDWRAALGKPERTEDWTAFFAEELRAAPWRDVVARWTARLAPAFCSSAMHGVIRVGHAVRSLEAAATPARVGELADAFASWTCYHQTLVPARHGGPGLRPRDAIARVPLVPLAERKFSGTIVSSLEALASYAPFADVAGLLDVGPDPARTISDMTETFARVYLANAPNFLGAVVFVHAVTSAAALRTLLPYLPADVAADTTRYAWQAGCALYSAFGTAAPRDEIEPPRESRATLVDLAIANGDEHAIKFTEACLREHALNPSPAYLAAARHAIDTLVL